MQQAPMKTRLKREIVSVASVIVLLFVYLPFIGSSWAIYVSICAGYTVLVLGLLWSDGKWKQYIERGERTARGLVLGHIGFLLAIMFWIWICRYSKPWLPDWMFNYGPRELTLYLIFSGLGIVAIWWAEQTWLSKPHKQDEAIGTSARQ